MKGFIIIGFIILTCSSCATLFNSPMKQLTIITDSPATVVMNNDTLRNIKNQTSINVLRQKKPILLTVFNDTMSKDVSIRSKNSFAYWSNFGFCYGIGLFVERKNPKRYTYPSTVLVSMKNKTAGYTTIDSAIYRTINIVKLAPLKLVDLENSGIELSYERRTSHHFATQVSALYLFPASVWDANFAYKPNIKGYRVGLEEKYYFKKSAPIGPYTSIELNYLNSRYRDINMFGIKGSHADSTNNYNMGYADSIRIHKQTISINFKFGYQFIIKRLSLDFFAGVGLRYKDVRHFDRINPKDVMVSPMDFNAEYISDVNGQYLTPDLSMNFRIGLKL